MKSSMIALSGAALLAFGTASAAPAASPAASTSGKTAQQTKMSTCAPDPAAARIWSRLADSVASVRPMIVTAAPSRASHAALVTRAGRACS